MQQNRHKILLIEPPFYRLHKDTYSLTRYPLSLGYLAGMIREETNWDVMAYNADFNPHQHEIEPIMFSYLTNIGFYHYLNSLKDPSQPIWKEITSTILEYKPDVIGISAKSQNFVSACIIAKIAKNINRKTIIILGGPHPSMVGSDVLKCPDIDICVMGEGENTITELLNAIDTQRELNIIKGIVYRNNGKLVVTSPREFIEDLDSLPLPYENAQEVLKDYDRYPAYAFQNIFAIRGCPYNCFFCGSGKIWTRRVRFRSPENVTREINLLRHKGAQSIHFDDDVFGVHKQYINDLCNAIIAHCPGLKWSCELHLKLVADETISLMKRAGCHYIQVGVESGNNEILKKIRKGIAIEDAFLACEVVKKHGMELQLFFMVGFPWDTVDTIRDTARVMKKIKCDSISYSIFTPYPGTEAFEFCRQTGLMSNNYDLSLYHHQSPANYFCANISQTKFRKLASKIERMVDRKNYSDNLMQIKRVCKSFKRGVKILCRLFTE